MRRIESAIAMASLVVAAAAPGVAAGSTAPAGVPVPAAPAGPPAPAWGVSEQAVGGHFSWGLDLAVDSQGHVHLVEAGIRNGKGGVYYTTDRGGSWVTRRIAGWSAGATYVSPSLALDGNDRVHIALDRAECVECTTGLMHGVFYVTDVGRTRGTFGTPVRLTPDGTGQGSLRVAAGHVFLAFAGGWGDTYTKVRLLTDASGHWTTSLVGAAGAEPVLRLSMNGRPRVLFESAGGLRFGRAATLTGAWTVEKVAGTDAEDVDPRLSIDENGGIHAAWMDRGGVTWKARYAHRATGGWTPGFSLGEALQVGMSVDKPDRIWVITGGEAVDTAVGDGSLFSVHQLGGASDEVAIKVLDSGAVVAAWVDMDTPGVWVAWN